MKAPTPRSTGGLGVWHFVTLLFWCGGSWMRPQDPNEGTNGRNISVQNQVSRGSSGCPACFCALLCLFKPAKLLATNAVVFAFINFPSFFIWTSSFGGPMDCVVSCHHSQNGFGSSASEASRLLAQRAENMLLWGLFSREVIQNRLQRANEDCLLVSCIKCYPKAYTTKWCGSLLVVLSFDM